MRSRTFNRRGPQPLKVGVYGDLLAALGEAVQPRDLQSALRAYTNNAGYLRALLAGACRIDLKGKPAGTVTPDAEKVAKEKLAEFKKGASPLVQVPSGVTPPSVTVASDAHYSYVKLAEGQFRLAVNVQTTPFNAPVSGVSAPSLYTDVAYQVGTNNAANQNAPLNGNTTLYQDTVTVSVAY